MSATAVAAAEPSAMATLAWPWPAAAAAVVLLALVLVAAPAPVGGVLLRRSSQSGGGAGPRVTAFLATKAKELGSVELTVLAHEAEGTLYDPSGMDKVKEMIQHMIVQKTADLTSSVTKGEYCNKELPRAHKELEKIKEEMDRHDAANDGLEAKIAAFADESKTLLTEVAELQKHVASDAGAREKEHAAYAELKAGYEKANTHDDDDAVKAQIKVETEEARKQIDFQRRQNEAVASIAAKEQKAKQNELDTTKMKNELSTLARDTRLQTDLLKSAKDYKQTLEKQCVVRTESYGERQRRRNEEIESMRDAYNILGGE